MTVESRTSPSESSNCTLIRRGRLVRIVHAGTVHIAEHQVAHGEPPAGGRPLAVRRHRVGSGSGDVLRFGFAGEGHAHPDDLVIGGDIDGGAERGKTVALGHRRQIAQRLGDLGDHEVPTASQFVGGLELVLAVAVGDTVDGRPPASVTVISIPACGVSVSLS